MTVLEESGDRQDVGARVHHDEVEDARQVESRQVGVVQHNVVQQGRDLLHQNWVKGEQQLNDVRQTDGLGEKPLGPRQRADDGALCVSET